MAQYKRKSLLGSFLIFLVSVLGLLCFRWALYEPFVIPSGSMKPTLLINDHILVKKWAFGLRLPISKTWLLGPSLPERGDIVVFRSVDNDSFYMIKRVVGLPGDELSYDKDGILSIDGQEIVREQKEFIPEEYYQPSANDIDIDFSDLEFFEESLGSVKFMSLLVKQSYRWQEKSLKVPEGHIFVMGDNRDRSKDSRYWGFLPIENLLGEASFVWLSCEERLKAAPYLCDPKSLRWSRFFHVLE